jgi:hypothetical protein
MSTNNFYKSDLMGLHNIVQSSMLVYPKEMIIATLRDLFSKDSYYHYSKDQWGNANTTDHTDLPSGGDIPEGHPGSNSLAGELLPTRLFIGENYRYDGIYYPAVLVKSGGSKYVPISINREQGGVQYEDIIYEDGYGNQTTISRPAYFFTAGVWEGSIAIDVMTRSLRARDDLCEAIAMCFTEITFNYLHDVGIIVKPINIGGASETDDRNDKLFRQTLTLDIRTEWRREIPISSFIDAIFFTSYFQDTSSPNNPVASNLTVNTEASITDILLNI